MRINFNFKPGDICNRLMDDGKKVKVEVVSVHFQMFRDGKRWLEYCVLPMGRKTMRPVFIYEDELEKVL